MTRTSAEPTDFARIRRWRDLYRQEMNCQVIHDSIHERDGWSREFLLSVAGAPVGYGSVAEGGPWSERPAIYEFYLVPTARLLAFELFQTFVARCGAGAMEVQSNGGLETVMFHAFAREIRSEAILFADALPTAHRPDGALFRAPTPEEEPDVPAQHLRWCGVVEVEGEVAATGGILFHYNRPYGDIYMEVKEKYRGRGMGTFIVQELKRICYEGGHVPAARCNVDNAASRLTLQKAGFVPCGCLLTGSLSLAV